MPDPQVTMTADETLGLIFVAGKEEGAEWHLFR
jgi:hypothetical protein